MEEEESELESSSSESDMDSPPAQTVAISLQVTGVSPNTAAFAYLVSCLKFSPASLKDCKICLVDLTELKMMSGLVFTPVAFPQEQALCCPPLASCRAGGSRSL